MRTFYQNLIKPMLFNLEPEKAHYLSMAAFEVVEKIPGLKNLIVPETEKYNKPLVVDGLTYKNPVGLAAGFDKDGKFYRQMSKLGFGFIEIGTVTPKPQIGNPRPRLFRLPQDESLINRMGFNNEGIDTLVQRLEKDQEPRHFVLGGNIGKNKDTPNDKAVDDYLICYKKLYHLVDYFTVNVSSPNTPGLRALQGKDALMRILSELQEQNHQNKPLYLKIAPDLNHEQILDILKIVEDTSTDGIISNNTSISRKNLSYPKEKLDQIGNGGLSGKKICDLSNEVLKILLKNKNEDLTIIASGGVHNAEVAKSKLSSGAALVQVYTGMIYQGPTFVRDILKIL